MLAMRFSDRKYPQTIGKSYTVYKQIFLIYLLLCLKVLITFFKMLQVYYPNMKTFKINTDSRKIEILYI